MSMSSLRLPRSLALFLFLPVLSAAEDGLLINHPNLGFVFQVSSRSLKKLPGGKWEAGPGFQASNPRGDLLVGPFVLDRVDSSSGQQIWSSRSLPVIPASIPSWFGKGQIRRGMPILFQPDGSGMIRGPIRIEGFSPRTRWKDVVVGGELKPLEAVAVDSVQLVDTASRLRIVGSSSTRISNGTVVFPPGAKCELDTILREGDSSGFRWMSGQKPSRVKVQGREGWKAKARWGSLEFELLIRDRRPPDPITATVLSIVQFLGSDTLRYEFRNDELLWSLRTGGSIACHWDSSKANPGGWRYRGENFRWDFASFRSPLTWRWSELVAMKAGQEFSIATSPPDGASAPWDDGERSAKPKTSRLAPPEDPVEAFAGLWWTVGRDWSAIGRIEGIGEVRYGRSFRWQGRDSMRLRGTLQVAPSWRAMLGDHATVDVVVAVRHPTDRLWVEPVSGPIHRFRIAAETTPVLEDGRTIRAGSGRLWWEPAGGEPALGLRAVGQGGQILITDSISATGVDSVRATPAIRVPETMADSEVPTNRDSLGIVVQLDGGARKRGSVAPSTFRCSGISDLFPEIVRTGLFQDGAENHATKWDFYQPNPFGASEIGGDRGVCVESEWWGNRKCCDSDDADDDSPGVRKCYCAATPDVGEGGFRSAYLQGYWARNPVTLSVDDVRIAVNQVLHPLSARLSLSADSGFGQVRLSDGFENSSLPPALRAFWKATGPSSRIEIDRVDTLPLVPYPKARDRSLVPGIPWIRLTGDTAAWNALVRYVDSLGRAGNPKAWGLRPVVEGMARSASGHASRAFWNGFVHGRTGEYGWLWRLDPGRVRNPMMAVRLDRDVPVGTLLAGFVGILQDPVDSTLRPWKLWLAIPYKKTVENPFVSKCCGQPIEF